MFNHKLQKIKKYLIDHLNKEFIFFSFASYVLLILMIEFINNNALLSIIFLISFFLNKDFHSCMCHDSSLRLFFN